MTQQITNQIFVDGKEMGFAAVSGENFYVPEDLGIKTRPCSTGCYRGYIMEYELKDNEIFIKSFLFRPIEDIELPVLNGVAPVKYTREHSHPFRLLGFDHEYINLNLKMPFTGTLWLTQKNLGYVPIKPVNFEFFGVKIPPRFWDVKYEFKEGKVISIERATNNAIDVDSHVLEKIKDKSGLLEEMKEEHKRLQDL